MYKQDSRPRLKRGPEGLGRGCANAHITKRSKTSILCNSIWNNKKFDLNKIKCYF
jgi:hypothetical protein